MNTDNAPVPVSQLHTIQDASPTPAEAWIKAARLREVYMPAVAALTLMIVALGAACTVVVLAILERVTA